MPRCTLFAATQLFVTIALAAAGRADDPTAFFEARIRPVLMEHCFTCHGGDKIASGLRVDALDHLLAGGDYGRAVVPGDPASSLLLAASRSSDCRGSA